MHDPRITAARPDLAASYLRGTIEAARFVDGEVCEIIDGSAPIRKHPFSQAMLDSEGLKGERFTVYERNGEGWAWGQLDSDGYVGWMPEISLLPSFSNITHRVCVLRTFEFPGASIKEPPMQTLSLNARVSVIRENDSFAITHEGRCIPRAHLCPINDAKTDFVSIAEMFLHTPYLWGGRSSLGIDCSGLVQMSLSAAGIGAPRDSDMQEQALGRALERDEYANLQRGDLIFWKGHVAIVRDEKSIIHANAHHMATEIEDLKGAISRIQNAGSEVTSIKRM